jgi:DnaK suppressor protein
MASKTKAQSVTINATEYLDLSDEELEALSDERFLEGQTAILNAERLTYGEQASSLKAEADLIAAEAEPGDTQFDEESGEGATATIDRERDLALAAQARAAIEEIDGALRKMLHATYGLCENCHEPIPRARLRALPFARLCVRCKEGGLSRRS